MLSSANPASSAKSKASVPKQTAKKVESYSAEQKCLPTPSQPWGEAYTTKRSYPA